MAGIKYNIDLQDNTRMNRLLKTILGIVCIIAAIWFVMNIKNTAASTTTSWIAVVFLGLFGLWEILSGAGFTERYIIIDRNNITIRRKPFTRPLILSPSEISNVEFRPLRIIFGLNTKRKITIELGTYNVERTASILEATGKFCKENMITVLGLNPENYDENHEG